MTRSGTDILISGASVAGPVLAYWLRRYGFTPVVVERTPELRLGTGGHAVDLFEPAVEVAARMGVLDRVRAARTRTAVLTMVRPGRRQVDVDLERLAAGVSDDRHVEVMRGELAAILHEATRDDVEYVFGDSISGMSEDAGGVDVTFDKGAPRRFDLVIGADGLHSTVRRLAFGPESDYRRFLGGYLAAFSLPNHLGLDGRLMMYSAVDKLIGFYPVWQTGEARAVFMLRRAEEFDYHHRDLARQKELLRGAFAGEGWEVPRLLAELDGAEDFYLDSISQILMDDWTRGRFALVGDAGYSPGPAIGGGTTVAVVGAYTLAGRLAAADGDHTAAFPAYQEELRPYVLRTREVGPAVMKTLVPANRAGSDLRAAFLRLLPRLPAPVRRAILSSDSRASKVLASAEIRDYAPVG
ncbi:FAD-dependent monooxygenase [Allonocardiopsis opalescens]|uniref:2-polyprenyl-6-methoxyphenol hydroxylase-like FAD-dependent oxidoreductase n=1 Tax=Allonocardiopsis opalescens TaxID=1144618 RepID=A0A2T0Q1V5_9ACTN|nr:FAD-dependent monooxygenase [Allonocardiopsis opalescens]PRX97777.1 2-polyprenyl-6-methoxyphenol hydroxylase-like FAD-dependent oxidoreductase [Allonocardiopsis opalescens]